MTPLGKRTEETLACVLGLTICFVYLFGLTRAILHTIFSKCPMYRADCLRRWRRVGIRLLLWLFCLLSMPHFITLGMHQDDMASAKTATFYAAHLLARAAIYTAFWLFALMWVEMLDVSYRGLVLALVCAATASSSYLAVTVSVIHQTFQTKGKLEDLPLYNGLLWFDVGSLLTISCVFLAYGFFLQASLTGGFVTTRWQRSLLFQLNIVVSACALCCLLRVTMICLLYFRGFGVGMGSFWTGTSHPLVWLFLSEILPDFSLLSIFFFYTTENRRHRAAKKPTRLRKRGHYSLPNSLLSTPLMSPGISPPLWDSGVDKQSSDWDSCGSSIAGDDVSPIREGSLSPKRADGQRWMFGGETTEFSIQLFPYARDCEGSQGAPRHNIQRVNNPQLYIHNNSNPDHHHPHNNNNSNHPDDTASNNSDGGHNNNNDNDNTSNSSNSNNSNDNNDNNDNNNDNSKNHKNHFLRVPDYGTLR